MPNTVPQSLKGFSLFVDGFGFGGVIKEMELPTISTMNVDHRAGGMNGAIELDMGLEKLECKFTMSEYTLNLMRQVGKMGVDVTGFSARAALSAEDPLLVSPFIATMRGRIKKVEPGTWKPEEATEAKFEATLCYYKLTHTLQTIYEIDTINCVRIVDGIDQLFTQRAILGF